MTIDSEVLDRRLDAPVVVRNACPSTNDLARAEGRDGAPHGTFVVAREQTAGRGRTGNAWASPPGGVWSSTLLYPGFDASHVGRLTFAGGLAAAETVESFGADARLKWPNDVVVPRRTDSLSEPSSGDAVDAGGAGDRAKLCGVLTEAVVDEVPVAGKPVDEVLSGTDPADAALSFAVLGVGVNADLDPAALDVDRAVTTLRAEVGDVDATEVAATLHERVLDWTERVETSEGFAAALDAWRERSATLDERVRVETRGGGDGTDENRTVVGEAVGVTDRGALVVECDGSRVEITEGECARLRRA